MPIVVVVQQIFCERAILILYFLLFIKSTVYSNLYEIQIIKIVVLNVIMIQMLIYINYLQKSMK